MKLSAEDYFNQAVHRHETDYDGKITDYTEALHLYC